MGRRQEKVPVAAVVFGVGKSFHWAFGVDQRRNIGSPVLSRTHTAGPSLRGSSPSSVDVQYGLARVSTGF